MTKADRADALLIAAKCWQNGGYASNEIEFTDDIREVLTISPDVTAWRDPAASMALSFVASLGFDIE